MHAANRFTVGSVLGEQAEARDPSLQGASASLPAMDHGLVFEEGLRLIVDGLARPPR